MKYERTIIRDAAWVVALRRHPCVFTGMRATDAESVVPMHIGNPGKGIKSDDEAWPILDRFHREGHANGEVSMIRQHAPDWLLREMARAWCREYYRVNNG